MQYSDLIFDLYGTLVDIHTEEDALVWEKTALYFSYYGAAYNGTELETDFKSVMSRRESAAGQSYEVFPDIPVEEVMGELFRKKVVIEDADALGLHAAQVFRLLSTEYIRLYDGVLDALDALRKAGCRLWLLSNAQRSFTAYELRHLNLTPKFDGVYLSSDYQCRKPDARFFNALLEEQQLDPQRCLMIGNDLETDIAGASAVGLATLYMHTNLTPSHQRAARPGTALETSPLSRHYEYEGANWNELTALILSL